MQEWSRLKIILKKMWNKHQYGEINLYIEKRELYKEFKTTLEAEEWGMKYYKSWANSYKDVMRLAKHLITNSLFTAPIECYCGDTYRQINDFLRKEVDSESNIYREMADILSIVLCSAPRIPTNIVLYRLVDDKFVSELIEQNKQDRPTPIQEKGFMSTSLLRDIVYADGAYACENNLLKIYVESDTIGIYVNAITKRSEEEMLLFPNMYLALTNYPYRDDEVNKMVYECKLIKFY